MDIEKAYDTVAQKVLFEVSQTTEIRNEYIQTTRNSHTVCVENRPSEAFSITERFQQGYVLSPTLFKVYINEVLKEWLAKCRTMRIHVRYKFLHTLLFSDDQVVIATDEDDINYVIRKLTETYEKWGLIINFDMTKYLAIGENIEPLDINGNRIDECRAYKYLGSVMSNKSNNRQDINNRIKQGKQAGHRYTFYMVV